MEIIKQNYLNKLNNNQREAVINADGPCLIVAGAGSGKTKVLTTRVVHIIKEKKAWPNQILCVTFTNKAAREMQNRIAGFLNEKVSSLPWLGTFHSVSAKILRRHAEAVGLNSRFTIIDQEDQLRLIKNICKAENIDVKKISPPNIRYIGYVNRKELEQYYKESKVYLQLSRHEAFGISVVEALKGGCLPIVSNCYALPEIIGDSGYVVKEHVVDEAVEIIKTVLRSDYTKYKPVAHLGFSIEERKKSFMKIL